jgi:hypothetical protein
MAGVWLNIAVKQRLKANIKVDIFFILKDLVWIFIINSLDKNTPADLINRKNNPYKGYTGRK